MNKKVFFLLLAALLMSVTSAQLVASNPDEPADPEIGICLDFQVWIDITKGNMPHPKAPVLYPCVYQNGHMLYLIDGCTGASVTLLNDLDEEVFGTYVADDCESIDLPVGLSGEYQLLIARGNFVFCTTIVL